MLQPCVAHLIWEAYESERGATLSVWRCVNLFWYLIDAITLQNSDCTAARWSKALAELSEATGNLLQLLRANLSSETWKSSCCNRC